MKTHLGEFSHTFLAELNFKNLTVTSFKNFIKPRCIDSQKNLNK